MKTHSKPVRLEGIAKNLRHTAGSATFVPGIDGMRAVAVAAVMLYHLDPAWLPGGFSGVDVFFVISGYVVSTSMSRDLRQSFGRFVLGFYSRRIVRIVPALVAVLLVSSLATNLLIPESWLSESNRNTALFAFFGLSNYALVRYSDGYFSPRTDFNPFLHTWSLAVEEQFYLLFPPLFYIWLHTKDRLGSVQRLPAHLVAVLLFASLAWAAASTGSRHDQAYYLLPSRFWELACGAWLFQMQSRGRCAPSSAGAANAALILGSALVLVGFLYSDFRSFPFPWALPSAIGSALLIVGVSSRAAGLSPIVRFLELPLVASTGKMSYSLYLWHWPVFVLMRWTLGLEGSASRLLAVAATGVLAFVSYRLLENPTRHNSYLRSRPRPVIVLGGLFVVALSFGAAKAMFINQPLLSLSVTAARRLWYPIAWPSPQQDDSPNLCGAGRKRRDIGGLAIQETWPTGCVTAPFLGRRLYVLGDSHALSYSTLLRMLVQRQGLEVWIYARGGCPAADLLRPLPADCEGFLEASLEHIRAQARAGDVLFLPSLRTNRLADEWGPLPKEQVEAAQEEEWAKRERASALAEAKKLLARLDGTGLRVVLDAPAPIFPAPAFRCSDWFNRGNPDCAPGLAMDRVVLLRHRLPTMDALNALDSFRPITVWDPFDILCPTATCTAFDPSGKPLFFDGDHLSAHGNRVLYPSFQGILAHLFQESGGTAAAP